MASTKIDDYVAEAKNFFEEGAGKNDIKPVILALAHTPAGNIFFGLTDEKKKLYISVVHGFTATPSEFKLICLLADPSISLFASAKPDFGPVGCQSNYCTYGIWVPLTPKKRRKASASRAK